jgi:hypothetical protein
VPSVQGVYLTLSARLQGSRMSKGGASMLSHVVKLYRIAGGDGATATDPGMCGGDGNRVFVSMDMPLHDSLIGANANKGAAAAGGKSDIEDVPAGANSFWRDSHDVGGAHAPFDISDETENGAPRGQVQYFADVTSTAAKGALGRTDLMALIDPYALEVDQDYDCTHNSNPRGQVGGEPGKQAEQIRARRSRRARHRERGPWPSTCPSASISDH